MAARVSVAVPVPFLDRLTYRVPDGMTPARGGRVLVPLGSRVVTGCVLDVWPDAGDDGFDLAPPQAASRTPTASELRDVIEVIDDEPFLTSEVVDLALWVAEYYMCGAGEALAAAAPPLAWLETRPMVRLTEAGRSRLETRPRGEAGEGPTALTERAWLETVDGARPVRRSAAVARVARRIAGVGLNAEPGPAAAREAERALRALEREGLVEITRELEGRREAFKTVRVARLSAAGLDPDILPALGRRQRELVELLRASPSGLETPALAGRGLTAPIVSRLAEKGLVVLETARVDRDPFEQETDEVLAARELAKAQVVLTGEQQVALDRLTAFARDGAYRTAVLHGVTGSGKTEVYRRLARAVVDLGRRVLILVPEIALTPAVAATFRHSFGDRVAIQHSGLSNGERHDQWHRIRRGEVDVVVGTRSAVFAPLASPGLVIVDEEHDTSYKQEESPRYHGRDVAIVRARAARALVVLGSATPALETQQNALSGRYSRIVLSRRVADRALAEVRIVNMREEYAEHGPDVVLSGPLCDALDARLAQRDQAIVLLNRRGFAASVFCRQCGDTIDCPNCSVSLTLHKRARRLRCHYCDYSLVVPQRCRKCGAEYLEYQGFGTERVEAELAQRFPGVRIARVDRDTIRRRGEITRVLRRFTDRQLDILVGTQMIAKGHDFPAVTLVGVISADVGLGLADFRAAERTFQLLTQVAGRAGRGDRPGEAIIQTLYPDHYSIQHARTQDYEAFFAQEIQYRRAMHYPPAVSLINVIVRGRTMLEALTDASALARALRSAGVAGAPWKVVGPAPAPLGKLRGEHRAQFFLKGTARRAMRNALHDALRSRPDLVRRVVVDVDAISVL